ncbi:hypothetical protein [Pelomonas sp. Root1444]|uniref:hypothetical protein n=1 Tax=Pelomonas sp. Root1444 TaxID=1736464 RepID=UPI00138F7AD3
MVGLADRAAGSAAALRQAHAAHWGAMCPAEAPEGTAMPAALSRKHIASAGRLGSGAALGPQSSCGAAVANSKMDRRSLGL